MSYRFGFGPMEEKVKERVAGRAIYQITLKDISEEEVNELERRVASYTINGELSEEDIKKLSLDPSCIKGLGYSRIKERYGFFECFRHIGNGRRGSIAYFAREREAHVELI